MDPWRSNLARVLLDIPCVPVPTLSRKVSDLEARLGMRLLIRTTRRLTLTDAGATYLAAARCILDQVEEAEREAAGEYTGPREDQTSVAGAPMPGEA